MAKEEKICTYAEVHDAACYVGALSSVPYIHTFNRDSVSKELRKAADILHTYARILQEQEQLNNAQSEQSVAQQQIVSESNEQIVEEREPVKQKLTSKRN